jgi:hypothetical protein
MPSLSHVALTLGLTLGATAAPNSIVTPEGAETLTVGILGGKYPLLLSFPFFNRDIKSPGKEN